MKKIISMMLVLLAMNFSFTSCSSDDDEGAPDSGTISENIEGTWFLTEMNESCSDEGDYSVVWDYNNPTEYGKGTDDYDNYNPELLVIEKVGNEMYKFTKLYYYKYAGGWKTEAYDIFELNGNIIDEGRYEDELWNVYIDAISSSSMVIVDEEKEIEENGIHVDKTVSTYRKMDL